MEKTKMTIHRALSELKLTDAKIAKKIEIIQPTQIYQKGQKIGGYIVVEEFEESAKATYASIEDLITRKNAIKQAIVESNAKTMVTIGNKEMSVADAITYKTMIVIKKSLLKSLVSKHNVMLASLNKRNEHAEAQAQALVEASYGRENAKISKEDIETIKTPFMEKNGYHLSNPLDIDKLIKGLEDEIGTFESEVDAVLSESNAITSIEV